MKLKTKEEIQERIRKHNEMEDCCCKTSAIHNLKWVLGEIAGETWQEK